MYSNNTIRGRLMEMKKQNYIAFSIAIHNVVNYGINQAKYINVEELKEKLSGAGEIRDIKLTALLMTKKIAQIAEAKDVLLFYKENFRVEGIYEPSSLLRCLRNSLSVWRDEALIKYESDEDWKQHVIEEIWCSDSLYDDIMRN